jgi:hypothetical protein
MLIQPPQRTEARVTRTRSRSRTAEADSMAIADGEWARLIAVLAYLTRIEKSGELVALVEQRTLRLYEQGKLTKQTEFASCELAIAELEKVLTRRTKAGWKLRHRLESAWIDWLRELEQVYERIVKNAKASGVTVSPVSMFQRLTPSTLSTENLLEKYANPEYAQLLQVGTIRMHLRLGDARLEHDYYFEVGAHRAAGDPFWQMRAWNDPSPKWGGWLIDQVLESRVDDEKIRHASAAEFRAWFPRFIHDDVMTFAIAELAN